MEKEKEELEKIKQEARDNLEEMAKALGSGHD